MSDNQQIFAFMMILARVSSFIAFVPLFSKRQLPRLVKAGLATALTVFWFGCLPEDKIAIESFDTISAILYLGKEVGIGFILAFLVGLILVPARIAGAYVGQEIGLSLASVSSPGTMDSSTLVTTIFETLAVLLFFGLDMHHVMIMFLHYSLMELGTPIALSDLPTHWAVHFTNSIFEHGTLIVGPIGICLMVLTVGLGLLNKAAPTLNLFSVGMTLRSGLGIFCLILFFPLIIHTMAMYFQIHQTELEKFLIYYQ